MDKSVKDAMMAKVPAPKKEHSPWIKHVLAVKAKNPGKSLKEAMSLAKASYKKKE
jgi:hypothetical protein